MKTAAKKNKENHIIRKVPLTKDVILIEATNGGVL